MGDSIFTQLNFVRAQTLKVVAEISEKDSLVIPEGFNNHIKWNLGHIYLAQERFAFHFIGEEVRLPDYYYDLFKPGTKPSEWTTAGPSIKEIEGFLENQMPRIEQTLKFRLQDDVDQPYTTSAGLTLATVEEFLSFCLYHEGMHFQAIKSIQRLS